MRRFASLVPAVSTLGSFAGIFWRLPGIFAFGGSSSLASTSAIVAASWSMSQSA